MSEEAPCPMCLGHQLVRTNVPKATAFGVVKSVVEFPCPRCSPLAAAILERAKATR